ncbi:MAG: putative alcohol dehydrogenase, cytochrome c subunit [Variovorax sp.]|nr:putative alcohol dehydrogenase, cytochrome c subunit [Variovorax sp.]
MKNKTDPPRSMLRRIVFVLLVLAALVSLIGAALIGMNLLGEDRIADDAPPAFVATAGQVERGRYLALAGNCAGCHTTRGGEAYAGGLAIDTPFGTIYSSNLTPDDAHGLGGWSAAHFWRAMHNGRSRDGRLLYPAFPYPNFTKVTREDSDAIYAYLRSVPAVSASNVPHALRFPYNTQAALAVWRALSFTPGTFVADAQQPAEWNRGAYLVDGLGHCIACHGTRNVLGATEEKRGLSGGLIPVENWYAPSLANPHEAGLADWPSADIVALLKNGTSPRGSVLGPMAEVVYQSTQHLSDADLTAMATYLKALPAVAASDDRKAGEGATSSAAKGRRDVGVMERGNKIFDQRCAYCHGDVGQGAQDAYPPLAGNRAVNMSSPMNLIQMVRHGGFLPATAGNPRPYGMPAFGHVLDDSDIAAVLTFVRGSWGNDAEPVSARDMMKR